MPTPRPTTTRAKAEVLAGRSLTVAQLDAIRWKALLDYGRAKLDETLANSAGQAGRVYRAALNKLEDQAEANDRARLAATTAVSAGKLTLPIPEVPVEGSNA